MTKVHTVYVQLAAPGGQYQFGKVAEGAYVVEDGVVILTDRDGKPARDSDGKRYEHKLQDGENAKRTAGRLTRKLRDALRDRSGGMEGFGGEINYPDAKYV